MVFFFSFFLIAGARGAMGGFLFVFLDFWIFGFSGVEGRALYGEEVWEGSM